MLLLFTLQAVVNATNYDEYTQSTLIDLRQEYNDNRKNILSLISNCDAKHLITAIPNAKACESKENTQTSHLLNALENNFWIKKELLEYHVNGQLLTTEISRLANLFKQNEEKIHCYTDITFRMAEKLEMCVADILSWFNYSDYDYCSQLCQSVANCIREINFFFKALKKFSELGKHNKNTIEAVYNELIANENIKENLQNKINEKYEVTQYKSRNKELNKYLNQLNEYIIPKFIGIVYHYKLHDTVKAYYYNYHSILVFLASISSVKSIIYVMAKNGLINANNDSLIIPKSQKLCLSILHSKIRDCYVSLLCLYDNNMVKDVIDQITCPKVVSEPVHIKQRRSWIIKITKV